MTHVLPRTFFLLIFNMLIEVVVDEIFVLFNFLDSIICDFGVEAQGMLIALYRSVTISDYVS